MPFPYAIAVGNFFGVCGDVGDFSTTENVPEASDAGLIFEQSAKRFVSRWLATSLNSLAVYT
jgi:hypothetical protein